MMKESLLVFYFDPDFGIRTHFQKKNMMRKCLFSYVCNKKSKDIPGDKLYFLKQTRIHKAWSVIQHSRSISNLVYLVDYM